MKNCTQYLYVDDFALTTSFKHPKSIIRSLSKALTVYKKYCRTWKLKINEAKTDAIFFTRNTCRRRLPKQGLLLNDVEVPWRNNVKYLGVCLDKRLTFKQHISNAILKSEKTYQNLIPILAQEIQAKYEKQIANLFLLHEANNKLCMSQLELKLISKASKSYKTKFLK